MLIAALLNLDNNWELPQCPSIVLGEINCRSLHNGLCPIGENEQAVATGYGMCSFHQHSIKSIVQTPKSACCMIPFISSSRTNEEISAVRSQKSGYLPGRGVGGGRGETTGGAKGASGGLMLLVPFLWVLVTRWSVCDIH